MANYKELTDAQKIRARQLGYNGLFAEPQDLQTAFDNAHKMIEAIAPEGGDRIAAITALHTVANAYAIEIAKATA